MKKEENTKIKKKMVISFFLSTKTGGGEGKVEDGGKWVKKKKDSI